MERWRRRLMTLGAVIPLLIVFPIRAWSQDAPPEVSDAAKPLLAEMVETFSEMTRMVNHTHRVLGYAQDIQEHEGGAREVVEAAAILHDIGMPRAREIHGSTSGRFQEMEGPPVAREILTRHHFAPDQIDLVCGIVANHHSDADPEIVGTPEFKALWDADWLVNFPGRHREANRDEKAQAIETIFKTERGKELARELFLG
jgi:hypothetical protein